MLLALLSATTNAFAQAGKNFIKPVDKNGFEVDSIISMRGDEIVYLRAGTEFDIKKSEVAYVCHAALGRIDITDVAKADTEGALLIPEPEHIGEAYMCNFKNGEYVQLEKATKVKKTNAYPMKAKTKIHIDKKGLDSDENAEYDNAIVSETSTGWYSNNYKVKIRLKPKYSHLRAKLGEQKIIIRVSDHNTNPADIILVGKFSGKRTRKITLKETNDITGTGPYSLRWHEKIPFKAEKYGASSFLLTLDIKESGEYCILLNTLNNIDDKIVLACFGV